MGGAPSPSMGARNNEMPRKTIDWQTIRKTFEGGETNKSELSRRFSVTREAIVDRMKRDANKGDAWTVTRQATRQATRQLTDTVIDLASKRASKKLESVGLVDAMADGIVSDLAEHLELSRLAVKAAKHTADRFFEGKILPSRMQNEADVLNSLLTALGRAATIGREVHGLRPGTPSVSTEQTDAPGKEYVVKHPPLPAPEAESA